MTEGRKVCTGMAEVLNVQHDLVYKAFNNVEAAAELARQELKMIAGEVLANKPKYLVLDDFGMIKPHADKIEGTDTLYDNSLKVACNGLQSVSAMLTDGDVKIPIDATLFLTKALGGPDRTTKTQIAEEIIASTAFDRAIWDAHYSTQKIIETCHKLGKSYLGKIARNRIVTIGGITGQIQNLLKLKKNRKILSVDATITGVPCVISAIKHENGKVVYLISNDHIESRLIVQLYKIRWKIELFHRTAKQKLGVRECQMRSFAKQELHVLLVMLAYARAERVRQHLKLKNTEEAIRLIRSQKRKIGLEITQLKAALS
jgi:hypothetical protein